MNTRPSFRVIHAALQTLYSRNEEILSSNPQQRHCKASLSSHDDELDLSMYNTSETSASILTNSYSVMTAPISSHQLNFIEKYTAYEKLDLANKGNESSSTTEVAHLLGEADSDLLEFKGTRTKSVKRHSHKGRSA